MADETRHESGEVGFCSHCFETVSVIVPPEDRLQARIARATAKRGYREGWTATQFLARQLAKIVEELGEAGAHLVGLVPPVFMYRLQDAADLGKYIFDARLPADWGSWPMAPEAMDRLAGELADVQVVLCNMAAALEELRGEPVDLMSMAAEKAEADVKRGVR